MPADTTIVCVGDSLTDANRTAPDAAPLGRGYCRCLQDLCIARQPARSFRVVNRGISGNTIVELDARWDIEVRPQRPDWLIVQIGGNDAGRVRRRAPGWEAYAPDRFRQHYRRILERPGAPPGRRIILMEPFILSADRSDTGRGETRRRLRPYQAVAAEMSRRYGTRLVRLQAVFDRHLRVRPSRTFSPDACHPSLNGSLVIAECLYAIVAGRAGRRGRTPERRSLSIGRDLERRPRSG